jgi:hypothetical protein
MYILETFPLFSQTILLFISNVSKVKGIAEIPLRQKETRNINVALFIFDKVLTSQKEKSFIIKFVCSSSNIIRNNFIII